MTTPNLMDDEQYGQFFDVRRSVRYHDRRRAFFERMHQITAGLTILMAGSVLFDIARPGDTPTWMLVLAATAALLSAWDMVVGYSAKASLHRELKTRFGELEIAMLSGDESEATWLGHRVTRLRIEQDEPPVFRALDLLCHNELIRADGVDRTAEGAQHTVAVGWYKRLTRHLFHWADLRAA